ncbi:MAG: hypothetical protein AAGD13_02015 [Pseudomonadota bacterium]
MRVGPVILAAKSNPRTWSHLTGASSVSVLAALAVVAIFWSGSAALARAPIVAPEPPRKTLERATIDGASDTTEDSASAERRSDEKSAESRKLDVDQAREQILKQLLRAAEAGIVDLQPSVDEEPVENVEATGAPSDKLGDNDEPVALEGTRGAFDTEETASKSSDAEGLSQSDPIAELDDLIEDALAATPVEEAAEQIDTRDDERALIAAPKHQEHERSQCFARERLLLPDFASPAEFVDTVSKKRRLLVGEFDAGDTETAVDLAKSYLSVGFTLEAKTIIDEYASEHPLGQFLRDASGLLDGKPAPSGSSVLTSDCLGAQALWRALSQALSDDRDTALRSELAAGNSLEEFPSYPRQVIAARLGLAATDLGEWDVARRMEAMALRAAKGLGSGLLGQTHLLSHALSTWREDPERAQLHLTMATGGDAETAVTALFLRADAALTTTEEIPNTTDLIPELGALARREAGTPLGAKAFELEARLFSRTASLADTISLLSDATEIGLLDPDRHAALLSELVANGTEGGASPPLAMTYLDNPAALNDLLEQTPLRRALIRSLAQVDLPAMGRSLVRAGDLRDDRVALALGDAFLSSDDPRETVAVLSEASISPLQRGLLGRAFLKLGDAERASGMLSAALDGEIDNTEARAKIVAAKLDADRRIQRTGVALETALDAFDAETAPETAMQTALLALEAGRNSVPDVARNVLEQDDTVALDTLENLFRLTDRANEAEVLSNDDIEQYLNDLETGEQAIEEVLRDG